MDNARIDPERIRLLADRLCWLAQGSAGLVVRHGMWHSDRRYRDEWDVLAADMAPGLLVPTLPAPVLAVPTLATPLQPTLLPGL